MAFSAIDLSFYPVGDILEVLSFEAYHSRDLAEFKARWEALRQANQNLPSFDTLLLESDPAKIVLQVGAYRELGLRAHINDRIRGLTLAGATGAALDHIGITYYRTKRRDAEDDETYRQRLAIAPESWSTAGPVGAYVFWALSASADLLDVAVYSEDEGVCLAPRVRVVTLPKLGTQPAAEAAMRASVLAALSRTDIRPLGDMVTVEAAVPLPFDLAVTLKIRSGASAEIVREQARKRLEGYMRGRLRWAGEGETGPVWLIGRTFTVESLAGVAGGGDPNILEVDVAGSDINTPDAGYTEAALAGVGTDTFTPLPAATTAHLFKAPMLGALTITTVAVTAGWLG